MVRGSNGETVMPVPPARTDNWAKGANNVANPERLPEGFVRHLVNLDPGTPSRGFGPT